MSNGTKTVWEVRGTQLTLNGSSIFLKGVCYSPTPWNCGNHTPRIGDWFDNKCSSLWSGSFPPPDCRYDLDFMKDRGINHLRTYFWWEWWWPAAFWTKVSVDDWIRSEGWRNQKEEYQFNHTNPRFWAALAEMAQAFKKNAPDKVTMVAFRNDAALFDTQIGDKTIKQVFKENFQIYGLNIYGDPSGSLQNFQTKVVESENGKYACPLIVSEWGVGGGKNIENPRYQDWIKSVPKPVNDQGKTPGPLEGPPFGMANAREFTPDEFNQRVSDLAAYFQAIMKYRDFTVGAEYFAWSDEWWKNTTADEIIAQIKSKILPLDEWGRYKEPGTGYLKFPTYLDKQEASTSPDWPEEYWGLHSIQPQNGGIKWGSDGSLYDPDVLTTRPTMAALQAAYARVP